jgi:hypothetical protein
MTAPTGTEATTARIAEVLAEHRYLAGTGRCQCGSLVAPGEAHQAHVAALLSAGVIRDMQAAALREAATALDLEPIPNYLWGQPNKKAWFCEGARWLLDQVRDRAARIEEGA